MPRLIALLLLVAFSACGRGEGQAEAKAQIAANCAACHVVPGVAAARGRVGPSLAGLAKRQVIAGALPNTPANLRRFLRHPQSIVPGGAMPELGLDDHQAEIIANYLLTLDKP